MYFTLTQTHTNIQYRGEKSQGYLLCIINSFQSIYKQFIQLKGYSTLARTNLNFIKECRLSAHKMGEKLTHMVKYTGY